MHPPIHRHVRRPVPRIGRAWQRGFSLLEIIIVLVLIGGILLLVGSRVMGGADSGRARLAQSQLETLAGKVETYQLDTGRLPERLQDLVTAPSSVGGWLGPYAKATDLQDPWKNPIEYRVPGDGRRFDLISLGADGQPGGESYNADIRNQ
ncbi:type II secretion system protein GspG [Pseudoxanthomonas kalamensis DSM 18571]|uniref:type II secretion system major pseudopilin GspG n=1 Tax=Pseudoxanthomonas kalamensis TaxID=289483 RepID=UPI001391586B|nr:type II secretion system major pseudopilin GspG [Pseudoxanthomonas kalamensis]KAF1708875.1 type II secretion system protein GspG [Pseudoxanthomonas kalamensis DSM 18571]